MSRRTQAPKRELLPDPKHGSTRLTKFINMIMNHGKKSVAENIVYDALGLIAEKSGTTEEQAVETLDTALENVKPAVEVKSRRVGGAWNEKPRAEANRGSSGAVIARTIRTAHPRGPTLARGLWAKDTSRARSSGCSASAGGL